MRRSWSLRRDLAPFPRIGGGRCARSARPLRVPALAVTLPDAMLISMLAVLSKRSTDLVLMSRPSRAHGRTMPKPSNLVLRLAQLRRYSTVLTTPCRPRSTTLANRLDRMVSMPSNCLLKRTSKPTLHSLARLERQHTYSNRLRLHSLMQSTLHTAELPPAMGSYQHPRMSRSHSRCLVSLHRMRWMLTRRNVLHPDRFLGLRLQQLPGNAFAVRATSAPGGGRPLGTTEDPCRMEQARASQCLQMALRSHMSMEIRSRHMNVTNAI